jgi:hypothetical protein
MGTRNSSVFERERGMGDEIRTEIEVATGKGVGGMTNGGASSSDEYILSLYYQHSNAYPYSGNLHHFF